MKEWDKAEKYRVELQNEVNSNLLERFSFEVYKKTEQEKEELKKAKNAWRSSSL